MKLQVKVSGFELAEPDERVLERYIERLERRLTRFDPDLVSLEVALEKQARREEYTANARLVIMNRVLPAGRNSGPKVRTLLRRVFDDLEEGLERFESGLRREGAWQRKRSARSPDGIRAAERRLVEERALLDAALTGERGAFDRLAQDQLAGVHRVIVDLLGEGGRNPTDEEFQSALVRTLTVAFRDLKQKPEGWTLYGWLAFVAGRELRQGVRTP